MKRKKAVSGFEKLEAAIEKLARMTMHEFTTLRVEIGERFDEVDGRFKKVDEQFEKVDERFDEVDAKLERLYQQADDGAERERILGVRVSKLETKVK